ncbi:glutamyl-tRNA(Gln) amidotransferase subunit B, mitochondrial isoform X2 [Hyalella azteca]|uniref:Glutamyl-tRNA(Gln) amidotransferase subunit B, mitochondrial isoform X2 n=1 Tax=Hyalella azteca TaxID=294128 RepID=A0A8B7NTF4_HYAAZ|nr:glutamyl-tRNA(Gln) amidotransferase subunit B, mitochondrial isoform X2 [Hyalella azteca]
MKVLNKACVEAAVLTALALDAQINPVSYFDRKHYFYPDMPAGYQITQQRKPLAGHGQLSFVVIPPEGVPYVCKAQLVQLQLEEDSGKSIHSHMHNKVLVDLNRAGVGLMELVFSPCLHSAAEAAALVRHLALVLRTLGVCTTNMNEGALRVDANLSVHKAGNPLGTRTEIKNLNSFRFLEQAINHELARQISILDAGGNIVNETRSFDPDTGTTASMRDKEGLQDYRFLPEPNLPPLRICDSSTGSAPSSHDCIDVTELRRRLPLLPIISQETLNYLLHGCQLSAKDASNLMLRRATCDHLLATVEDACGAHVAAHDLSTVAAAACLLLHCHSRDMPSSVQDDIKLRLPSPTLWSCAQLLKDNRVRLENAKEIVAMIVRDGDARSPQQIAEEENWLVSSDVEMIEAVTLEIVRKNPELVATYLRRSNNPKKLRRPLVKLSKLTREALGQDADETIVENSIRRAIQMTRPTDPE